MSDVLGLRVEIVEPSIYATGINVNSEITISFNSELNTRTVPGNILILKDTEKKFSMNSTVDLNQFDIVEGSISYKDKKILFKPTNQLDKISRYIIYVKKNSVTDILGMAMLTDFVSCFDTEDHESYARCNVLEPVNNSIIQSLEQIIIEDIGSYRYILQVSKTPTFENVILDEVIDGAELKRDFALGDGLYYVRAKAENGNDFGTPNVFSIKSYTNTVPTDEDIDEDYIYQAFDDEVIELIQAYPELDSVNNNVKTNLTYLKFNQLIPLEDIDYYESELVGKFIDDDDQFNNASVAEHGQIEGSYLSIFDSQNSETYVFFIPDSM